MVAAFTAAKEEIFSPPMVCSGDGVLPLAADLCAETLISTTWLRGQKPHQGVAGKNLALDPGSAFANLKIALGLRGAEPENRIGSRCTGKERDSESGLDYFGARYNSSQYGRFMTPDPSGLFLGNLNDPQQLNLYSYVRNNPLNAIDQNGTNCVWDDGSYDADDDPATGTQDGCEGEGGTWINQVTGDWNPNPNADLAAEVADIENSQANPDATVTAIACEGMSGPVGVSVAANIENAENVEFNAETVSVLPGEQTALEIDWMNQQFPTGAPQDYKTQFGQQGDYTNFGNFNFGAVCGTFGFSLTSCQSFAGAGLQGRVLKLNAEHGISPQSQPYHYQNNGQGIPFLKAPFGDQPGDASQIANGYAFQQSFQAQGCK